MTTGALIFAFNNDHTDYLSMAAWCANNVRRYLDIPVAVITNAVDHSALASFDQVIFVDPQSGGSRWFADYQTHVTWYNAGRADAYDLSPWDNTLVLDSDFVVNSGSLAQLFDSPQDFLCFRHCSNIVDPDQILLPTFGRFHMPMWWATVMWFRRSNTAHYIFDSMKMIRSHWTHYRDLYGIAEETFRNDYALSIAIGIVSGHTWQANEIPWNMLASLPEHRLALRQISDQQYWIIDYQNSQGKDRTMSLVGVDFHAMGKQSLGAVIAGR